MATAPIVTGRLRLRPYLAADREDWIRFATDVEVNRYGEGPMSPSDAGAFFDRFVPSIYERDDFDVWAVTDGTSGAYAGHAELKPSDHASGAANEIVYFLLTPWWGRGLGTELAAAVVEHGRHQRGLAAIVATIHPDNAGSIRIVEHLGFQLVATEDDGTLVYRVDLTAPSG